MLLSVDYDRNPPIELKRNVAIISGRAFVRDLDGLTYTDVDGTKHQARFLDGELPAPSCDRGPLD